MSSASMVSCLLSVCYLVLGVPIIFKLALELFQRLRRYSSKLWWRVYSLFEQQAETMEGLVGRRRGVWWGKTERVHVYTCQISISESI